MAYDYPGCSEFLASVRGIECHAKKGGAPRLYSVLAGSRTQFASIQKTSRLPRLLVGESKPRRSSGPGSERTMNSTNCSAKKLRLPWSADLLSAIYFSVSNIPSFKFSLLQVF